MDVELDVLREAASALRRANGHCPEAPGPQGLGLYAPLAAALQRLGDWVLVRSSAPPPRLSCRCCCETCCLGRSESTKTAAQEKIGAADYEQCAERT